MTYNQAVQYLFDSAPMFQNVGAAAYKEGLGGTLALDEHFGHPHRSYRTIHVGGTNGKGSVCHTLAAILQAQGYRVGLYTSPHLVDFRERIRVNGKMISKKRVIEFVEDLKASLLEGRLEGGYSFFELATALAFKYFEEQKVDFAIIEVGLGGRLDCTNIITPILSVITNISFDHVQFLGDTLPKIASEKAGIIKPGIPVCIGENINPEVKAVFQNKADEVGAPITFAEESPLQFPFWGSDFKPALTGLCQEKNTRTILTSVRLLRESGIEISEKAIERGFAEVCTMTGLMGRWQILSKKPLTICDTAHNVGGLQYIFRHLASIPHQRLHLVIGMVSDKDVNTVLTLVPKDAICYFTQASVNRAMPAEELTRRAKAIGMQGATYTDVASAYDSAISNASADDIIYIGGSTFVVADLLAYLNTKH
ncbi:MAG: bifunctional folylpolyglutamate synthase/dihydrofolate synthase [Bacteroidaceae bacterium]|nr:bifunctional folylpolyglutamate synthase/dihydrofolate synthase [Bacteroidaceae bacterium]